MARREDVETSIWSDPEFLNLTPPSKLVYLWSFTNPRCGMAGVYKLVRAAIVMETGMNVAAVDAALGELQQHRFVYFDGRVMWVRSRVKHLRMKGETIAKAIRSDLESVAPHEYVNGFVEMYSSVEWLGDISPLSDDPNRTPIGPLGPLGPHLGSQGKGKGKESEFNTKIDGARAKLKFDGKAVPDARRIVAEQILFDFNRQANTSYRPLTDGGKITADFSRIIGAVTDDARLTAEVGARMTASVLAGDRYWTGHPHPGLVFGEKVRARLLEDALNANHVGARSASDYVALRNGGVA